MPSRNGGEPVAQEFSTNGMRVLSAMVHFLGVSVVSHCLSRRLAPEQLTTVAGLKRMTWPRICVLGVLFLSWSFIFVGGIMILGVGLETNAAACAIADYLCIGFYAGSKIFIYFYLVERVYLVWSPTQTKRFKSRLYTFSFVTVAMYGVIAALLCIGNLHYFRAGDGVCVVGLQTFASIPLLSYDLYVNIFLTSLFLWPLFQAKYNPRLRRVALRSLIAAVVALLTSTANILILTIFHGKELGWVCLASCGTDVIFNALGLFWVTSGGGSRQSTRHSTVQGGHGDRFGEAPEAPPTHGSSNVPAVTPTMLMKATFVNGRESMYDASRSTRLSDTTAVPPMTMNINSSSEDLAIVCSNLPEKPPAAVKPRGFFTRVTDIFRGEEDIEAKPVEHEKEEIAVPTMDYFSGQDLRSRPRIIGDAKESSVTILDMNAPTGGTTP